jgi:hypothetical protein
MTTKELAERQKSAAAGRILVVATNPEYGKMCAAALKRLPSKMKVELMSCSKEGERIPKTRAKWTLVVSQLSDVTKRILEIVSAGATIKQLVFLDSLPVQAIPTRLMPLNIRDPKRIHIAAQRDPASMEALIYRLIRGLAIQDGSPTIVDAWIENEHLVILSPNFSRLRVAQGKLSRLLGTEEAEIAAFAIDEDGRYLHWPHADVHLGWTQFQQMIDPASVLTAAARTGRYNRRYGAAIRALRESRGLKQTEIHGLTDRHLRRVEKGLQTASKATLEALAKAHSLSLEEYIDRLAQAVGPVR